MHYASEFDRLICDGAAGDSAQCIDKILDDLSAIDDKYGEQDVAGALLIADQMEDHLKDLRGWISHLAGYGGI